MMQMSFIAIGYMILAPAIAIAVTAVVAYFVIKKAVKDAIRESKEEGNL